MKLPASVQMTQLQATYLTEQCGYPTKVTTFVLVSQLTTTSTAASRGTSRHSTQKFPDCKNGNKDTH